MTNFTRDWIAKREQLEQAATEGPWRAALLDGVDYEDGSSSYRGGVYPGQLPGPAPLFVTNSIDACDAALIADARTSLPAALAALKAVLGATEGKTEHHGHTPLDGDDCAACLAADVRDAVEAALRGES